MTPIEKAIAESMASILRRELPDVPVFIDVDPPTADEAEECTEFCEQCGDCLHCYGDEHGDGCPSF